MLRMVYSGGQTGADQGGLFAAKKVGLETGGWAPYGYKTEDGPAFWLRDEYGLKEHPSLHYKKRTEVNVAHTDGTLRFAINFRSAGEICTMNAINKFDKPWKDINIHDPLPIINIVAWLRNHDIVKLNIAGNKESTYPGICKFVEEYLIKVFNEVCLSDRETS